MPNLGESCMFNSTFHFPLWPQAQQSVGKIIRKYFMDYLLSILDIGLTRHGVQLVIRYTIYTCEANLGGYEIM